MEVEVHLFVGSLFIFCIAIFLAFNRSFIPAITPISDIFKKVAKGSVPPKEERRAYPRYKTSLRARFITPIEEGVFWIRDISRGGIGFVLDKSLQIGTLMKMEITLPYDTQPIFLQGNIVWTKGDRAGLSFNNPPQDQITRILRYIDNRHQINLI